MNFSILGAFAVAAVAAAVMVYGFATYFQAVKPKYSVVVGNVGTVYAGDDEAEARKDFAAYATQSRDHYGRASGESVFLLRDGEPISEHYGDADAG